MTGGSGEPEPDYYAILRVREDATSEEIKNAYRRLAPKYHPDTNQSADALDQIRLLNQAYEVLGNHGKKAEYDHGRRIETGPELEIQPEVVDFGVFRYGDAPIDTSIRVEFRNHGGDVYEVAAPNYQGPQFYSIRAEGSADPEIFAEGVVEFDPFTELEPGDYAGVAECALIGPGGESRKELLVRCQVKAIPARMASPTNGQAPTAAASPTTPSATRAASTAIPSVRLSPGPTPGTPPVNRLPARRRRGRSALWMVGIAIFGLFVVNRYQTSVTPAPVAPAIDQSCSGLLKRFNSVRLVELTPGGTDEGEIQRLNLVERRPECLPAPPRAKFKVVKVSGLKVTFNASASRGDRITYSWLIDDMNFPDSINIGADPLNKRSTAMGPSDPSTLPAGTVIDSNHPYVLLFSYSNPGDYDPKLTVMDAFGRTSSYSAHVTVSGTPPDSYQLGGVDRATGH